MRSLEMGFLPPQAIELEEFVLGAIMIESKAIIDVVELLKPIDFYREAHIEVYKVCVSLFNRNMNIDMSTVAMELKKIGKLEQVGGPYFISQLCNKIGSTAHIVDHAGYIKECSLKRQLIDVSAVIMKKGYEDTTEGRDLLNEAMDKIISINAEVNSLSQQSFRDATFSTISQIKEAGLTKSYMTGLPYYIGPCDRHTLGMQNTDLIIIAARPGMGKTAFALQVAKDQAKNGHPVGFISLEMSTRQLILRVMSNEIEVDVKTLQKGGLREYEWKRLDSVTTQISDLPMYLNDKGGLTVEEVMAIAKAWKLKHGIKALYIDYLQLLHAAKKTGSREQEISYISSQLKALAKNLDIPVIALSQLSRACETRGGDKRPMLSDLRESGSIEQDADAVIFLYRAEYYKIEQDNNGNSTIGVTELDWAKFRSGDTGIIRVGSRMDCFKFSELQSMDHPY